MNITMEELVAQLEQLYPHQIEEMDHPFASPQFHKRFALCQDALRDTNLMNSWENLKNQFANHTENHNIICGDNELVSGVPAFRFGMEIENSADYKVFFYFVISIIQPVFSYYFIDYEKFTKINGAAKNTLGPLKEKFLSFGLSAQYDDLAAGRMSAVDIDLPTSEKLRFLMSSPRLAPKKESEQAIITLFSELAKQKFPALIYLPKSMAETKLTNVAPKMPDPKISYTIFDCLFMAEFNY